MRRSLGVLGAIGLAAVLLPAFGEERGATAAAPLVVVIDDNADALLDSCGAAWIPFRKIAANID